MDTSFSSGAAPPGSASWADGRPGGGCGQAVATPICESEDNTLIATSVSCHRPKCTRPTLPSPITFLNCCASPHTAVNVCTRVPRTAGASSSAEVTISKAGSMNYQDIAADTKLILFTYSPRHNLMESYYNVASGPANHCREIVAFA